MAGKYKISSDARQSEDPRFYLLLAIYSEINAVHFDLIKKQKNGCSEGCEMVIVEIA